MSIREKIKQKIKRRNGKGDEFWRPASLMEGRNSLEVAKVRAIELARRGFDVLIIEEETGELVPTGARKPLYYLMKSRASGKPTIKQINRTVTMKEVKPLLRSRLPRITPKTPRLRR